MLRMLILLNCIAQLSCYLPEPLVPVVFVRSRSDLLWSVCCYLTAAVAVPWFLKLVQGVNVLLQLISVQCRTRSVAYGNRLQRKTSEESSELLMRFGISVDWKTQGKTLLISNSTISLKSEFSFPSS